MGKIGGRLFKFKEPIAGNIVVAPVNLMNPESLSELKKTHSVILQGKLAPYKIPVRVETVEHDRFSPRFKRIRQKNTIREKTIRNHAEIENIH